jgi:hypothetical protein
MSKRSKRRRDPATAGGAEAAETPHAPGKVGGAASGRTGEARRAGRGGRDDRSAASARPGSPASRPASSSWGLGLQLAFLVAVFAVVVLVAELAGAANLGVAFGIGQIGFAIAVVYLLLRR